MSDYPMLISNKLHSFRNFDLQSCMLNPPGLSGEPCNPPTLSKRLKISSLILPQGLHDAYWEDERYPANQRACL